MNNWYLRYDWRLKQRARENRKNPTKSEYIMWNNLLRNKQFYWFKFLRQKMLDYFIADFYCSKLKLIIEIDWWYHHNRQVYDNERWFELNKLWLNIIRFTNDDIINNLSLVHKKLYDYINSFCSPW